MNVCEPFIRRPVMTTLLMLGLFIFGCIGYYFLPVNNLPNVDYPTIVVSASLPGASPATMAATVATPLERQFATISGIDSMSSSSSQGKTQITLQFALNRSIDAAAADVQAGISGTLRQLPKEMQTPPSYRKVNPAAAPILYLALSSDILPLSVVDDYAENLLAQRISMIDGVAEVAVRGAQKYAVRVQVDPDILAARGIGIDEVANAISQGNVNMPSGTLSGVSQTFLVQAEGQLKNAAAYRDLSVKYHNDSPVKLSDLGNVIDDVENQKVAAWYNDSRAVVLAISRQPGSNTIAVVDGIKKILPAMQNRLPDNLKLQTIYDLSDSIRASIHDVQWTLFLAMILVVLVIFLFLRNLTTTIIPSIVLPLSIMGTFAAMILFGFSLNNLSLLALTLSVGFVVDDAIVMLENIVRYVEQGKSKLEAALLGSKEIGFTIISMTLSLGVVFVPILFLGGIVGRLFHEFAVTICTTIVLSGLISLTLTPMLCSRFLRAEHKDKVHSLPLRLTEKYFKLGLDFYDRTLKLVLKNHKLVLWIFLGTVILSIALFITVPKGFLPSEDTGQVVAHTEGDAATSFIAMRDKQQVAAQIARKNPAVDGLISSVGAGWGSTGGNGGELFIRLKSRSARSVTADEVVESLRKQLSQIPGFRAYVQNIPSLSIGKFSKSSYQYTLQDADFDELSKWADIFKENLSKLAILQDLNSDLQYTGPQVEVNINRDEAAALGVTAEQIENALLNAYGSKQVSTIYGTNDTYSVILEVTPDKQTDPNSLAELYIKSSNNKLVPLSAVADIKQSVSPASINHQGQIPSITLSFNVKPDVSLSTAVAAIEKVKDELKPPATLTASFQGTAQTFQNSVTGLGVLLILTLLITYIVLGILYESFIHPLTILSGLPSAAIGALITLFIFRIDLNLYSFIGIIMLIGIVKKNAIMMIDFALTAQKINNISPQNAIYQACLIRFRPIMMTTMAALLGAVPIALSFGAGGEARRPLGLAVIGGLLISQLLTLYITPVIYLGFEKLKKPLYTTNFKNT